MCSTLAVVAGSKKGVVAGAALAGVFGLRFADDCAAVGAKGARVGDDVVRASDDALEAGVRVADDTVPAPSRVQWGPPEGAAAQPVLTEGRWVDALKEAGVDVAVEVARYDRTAPVSARPRPHAVKCPSPHDLTLEPERWSAFLGGLGIACAPAVFIAQARGDALEVDGRWTEVSDLLQQCEVAGGLCFFVGCEGQGRCFTDARRAAVGVGPGGKTLDAYVAALAHDALAKTDAAWVAYASAPGAYTLVRRS